jgi:hypothetical protein
MSDWHSDLYPTSIVYPPNRFLSAKVRVFVDWVVDLFEHDRTLTRHSRAAMESYGAVRPASKGNGRP